jgi:hypothetical protein
MNEVNKTDIASLRDAQKPKAPAPVSSGFDTLAGWELMQRQAMLFASSSIVPAAYSIIASKDRNQAIGNCVIALDMAQRMRANPLMVMQNLYSVHGNPAWSAKFLIATVNTCGRFSALRYEWAKCDKKSDDYGCRAWAIEKDTGEKLEGVWVTWKMVKSEGWDKKNGSKWLTMPDQMFTYRAASFWVRAYAPELSMGLQTAEEVADVWDATRGEDGAYSVAPDAPSIVVNTPKKTVNAEPSGNAASPDAGGHQAANQDAAEGRPVEKPDDSAPTFEDAAAAVYHGDFDTASDIARGLDENQRKKVEALIANAKKKKADPTATKKKPASDYDLE